MSYQPLAISTIDDPDSDVPSSHFDVMEESTHSITRRRPWSKYRIAELALFVICCGVSFVLGRQRAEPKALIGVPPLKSQNGAHQRLVQWNISFSNPSIYRGEPSPTVDAAWERAEKLNIISASAADLRKAGTNPHAIPLPGQDDHGGYMASLEIVYHMHCLNLLRKASFVDHERYKKDPVFEDPVFPVDFRIRICADVLRHALACQAGDNLMASYWVKGYPRPFPNLNTWHTCSDYDGMMAWAENHKVAPPRSWKEWRTENVTEFGAPLEAESHPRPEIH